MGKRVTITRDDGELGTIDESELAAAQASGFRVVDEGEAKVIEKRRAAQSTAGMVIGTGEALARGVTMGASDVGLRALGVDMEAARARKENLGTLGAGAEIVGAAAPALLTGGTSAGASAAGAAARTAARFTPAGLVARAGAAAEGVAGRALGTGLRGKVAGSAAQGAVEGFASGVGAEASAAALGDQDLAVERLMAGGVQGLGVGALLGGGLGAAGVGVERAAARGGQLGRRALGGLGDAAGKTGESLADLSPQEGLLERGARLVARVQGGDEGAYVRTAGRIRTPEGRARVLADLDGVREKTAADILEVANRMNAAVDDGVKVASGASKQARIEQLLAPIDQPGRRGGGGRFVRRPRSFAVEHLEQHGARLRAELDDDLLSAESKNDLREALRLNEVAQRNAKEIKSAPEAYRQVDDYKRAVDQLASRRYDQYKTSRSPEALKAWEKARSFSDESRAHLENTDLYGDAAVVQREINAAKAKEMRAVQALPPQLRKFLERGAEGDSGVALQLARGATRAGGRTKQELFDAAIDARLEFLQTTRKHFDLDDAQGKAIDDAQRAIEEMRAKLAEQGEVADALDDLAKLRKDEGGGSPSITLLSTVGPAAGAGLGMMLGGLPGAMIGSLAGIVMRPFTLARAGAAGLNMLGGLGRYKAGLETVASREASVVAGFERLASGGRSAVRTAARAARRGTTRAGRSSLQEPQETRGQRQARLLAVRTAVMVAAQDPLGVAEQMEESVSELHGLAPEVARGVVERSSVAVQFLASKAPDVYESEFGSSAKLVAPEDLDRFERYVDAVTDPIGAAEKIAAGGFSLEHAEALRVVYPKIFSELQSRALDLLGRRKQEGRPISEESLVELGLMLDMPLTDSLKPGFLSSLQQPTAPPAQSAAAPRRSKPIDVTGQRTDLGRLEAGALRR